MPGVQRVATRREILQSRHGCHALQFAAPALQRDKELQALQRAGAKHWQHSTMPLPDQHGKKDDANRTVADSHAVTWKACNVLW